jgi:hypothetical protein
MRTCLLLFSSSLLLPGCSGKDSGGDDDATGGESAAGTANTAAAGETSASTSGASSVAGASSTAGSGGRSSASGGSGRGGNGASGKGGNGASGKGGNGASGKGGNGGASGAAVSGSGGSGGSVISKPWGEVVFGSLTAGPDTAGDNVTFAYARFYPKGQRSSPDCESREYERCTFWSCVPNVIDDSGGPDDAGAITILSEEDQYSTTLFADANGRYDHESVATFYFGGEELVTISALGDEIPAFRLEHQIPLVLLLTQPQLPVTGDFIDVPRDAALDLRWDRGTAGVVFTLQSSDSIYPRVACNVPSEVGALTLPADLLGRLSEGNLLTLYTIGSQSVTAGDYTVHGRATSGVMNPERSKRITLRLE